MTVDVSKLREGDVVHVRCRVLADGSLNDINEAGEGVGHRAHGWREAVVSVEPRSLKVGDRAHYGRTEVHIRALENGWAWTTWPNSTSGTVINLSDLSPA